MGICVSSPFIRSEQGELEAEENSLSSPMRGRAASLARLVPAESLAFVDHANARKVFNSCRAPPLMECFSKEMES